MSRQHKLVEFINNTKVVVMSYGAPYPRYGGPPPIPPRPVLPRTHNSNAATPYPTSSNSFPVPGGASYGAAYGSGMNTSYGSSYAAGGTSSSESNNMSRAAEIDASMKQLTDDLISGVIKSARNEDLESLINDDEKLLELINDSQITKDLKQKSEDMASFIKDQATMNLSLKPEFEVLQTTLRELSQRQNELRDRYLNFQNKLGNSVSSDTILSLLQVATGEQETLSDDMKMNFYDGDISVDEFIKQFAEGRKLYQLRKIKSEKLRGLLQGGGQQPSHQYSSGYGRMPPPVPQPVRYGAQYLPYPK